MQESVGIHVANKRFQMKNYPKRLLNKSTQNILVTMVTFFVLLITRVNVLHIFISCNRLRLTRKKLSF